MSIHKYRKKTCKKGKQCEYRPREGPGTARTPRSVLVVYINSRKWDPTYTPHEKTPLYFWFYFGFTPSLPSPLYLFFCFLPLPFFFLFAYFYPFTRNPEDMVPTLTTLHTLPQNIGPCSQLASPAAEWEIIVNIKRSGILLSSSLILRTCDQASGSCRAGLPQPRCVVIQPPGPFEGAGPVQWRVLFPLSAPCVMNHP